MAWRSTVLAVRPGRLRAIAALATLLVLAGGCGDDDGAGTPRATATATVAALPATAIVTATTVTTATAPATAAPSATPPPTLTFTSPPTATPEIPTATATTSSTATPDVAVLAKYAERGPYVVGVTTLDLGDRDIEVWYPVDPGSETGVEKASYASFEVLPEAIQQLLPPDLNIVVEMDAYRDLPISGAGPFPILTFSHGAGGFRQAYSGLLDRHRVARLRRRLARSSRVGPARAGRPAAAGDQPRAGRGGAGRDRPPGHGRAATRARRSPAASTPTRVATAGHSAGGRAAFALPDRPEVRAMLGYATGALEQRRGRQADPPAGRRGRRRRRALEEAYDDLSPIKRFVSIDRAGHNSFTDQCAIIHGGNNFLDQARRGRISHPAESARPGDRRLSAGEPGAGRVLEGGAALHRRPPARRLRPGRSAGRPGRRESRRLRRRDAALSQRRRSAAPPADVRGFVVSGLRLGRRRRTTAIRAPAASTSTRASTSPPLADDCADPQAQSRIRCSRRSTRRARSTGVDLDGIASRRDAPGDRRVRARRLRRPRRRAGHRSPVLARRSAACAASSRARSPTSSSTRRCATGR